MMKMQFSNCLKISEKKTCCYIRLIHRIEAFFMEKNEYGGEEIINQA